MIGVSEGRALVSTHARPLPPATTPVTTAALGLVLAEDVASDLAMPPFDDGRLGDSVDFCLEIHAVPDHCGTGVAGLVAAKRIKNGPDYGPPPRCRWPPPSW